MSDSYYKSPYSASSSAGRWNPSGSRMIYAGSAPTVALLEYLCIKGNAVGSKPWYMIVYEIANESLIGALENADLPADWATLPHAKGTQEFGKQWLDDREFPFLKVPSSRISIAFYPLEFNLLINPEYPDIAKLLTTVGAISFNYLLNT